MIFPVIIWFRQDLRLRDNPAFIHAATLQRPIIAAYINDTADPVPAGEAGRWWLHHSLKSLEKSLQKYGIPLILRQGNCYAILNDIMQSTNATAVYWNRLYRQYCCQRDRFIKEDLLKKGYEAESFIGNTLIEPWNLLTQSKTSFKVFHPFWKALIRKASPLELLKIPKKILGYKGHIASDTLESWYFEGGQTSKKLYYSKWWKPGEQNAQHRWQDFLSRIDEYHTKRNFPGVEGTSRLSPYLHFGEISVRQLWKDIEAYQFSIHFSEGIDYQNPSGASIYVKELGWRDFFQHLLYHIPDMAEKPLQKKIQHFQWASHDQPLLEKWHKGLTGYPLVDAGMRQLFHSGWMHNRVRMVVASFLVKHLLIDWRKGEKWFWEKLLDADHSSNVGNWQWVAGCGADAAPYFRIFNPVLQSQKFDPQGTYIKEWIPELEALPKEYIHQPWKTPKEFLNEKKIILGKIYPFPIVEHEKARTHALEMYGALKDIYSTNKSG